MPLDPRLARAQQAYAAQQALAQRGIRRGVQQSSVGAMRGQRQIARQVQQDRQREAGKTRTQRILDQQQGAKSDEGSFWDFKGILDNPIVKGVTKGLDVLDYGRRGVILGMETAAKALPDPLEFIGSPLLMMVDEDRKDDRSALDKLKDPEYGWGQVMQDTGNEWVDRALGFAGDVGLDPLTYLTLGAAKVPGAAGRAALFSRAVEQGLPREVAELAARKGGNAITDVAHRTALGLAEKPGLRFGVQAANVRIPGTEYLARGGSEALNAVRERFTDTGLGRMARKWGVSRDPELRAAFEQVVTGRGGFDPVAAIQHAKSTNLGRAGKRITEMKFVNAAEDIAQRFKDDPSIVHLYEEGVENADTAMLGDLARGVREHQLGEGVSVGQLAEGRPYVPHLLNDNGMEAFEHETSQVPRAAARGRTTPQGHQRSRQLVPGETYVIKGHEFTPVTGTIKEANDWGELVGLGKLYEDSPALLASKMVESAAGAVGDARYYQTLMSPDYNAAQVFRASDPRATHAVERIADEATGAKVMGQVRDDLTQQLEQAQGRFGTAADEVRAAGDRTARAMQFAPEAQRRADEAAARLRGVEAEQLRTPDVTEQLAAVSQQGRRAAAELQDLQALASRGAEGPRNILRQDVTAAIDEQEQLYRQLEGLLAEATDPRQQERILGQMVARRRAINSYWDEFAQPVEGAVPEMAPLESRLQELAGEHGRLTAQQERRAALGPERERALADQLELAAQAREAPGQVTESLENLAAARAEVGPARTNLAETRARVQQAAKGLSGNDSYAQVYNDLNYVAQNPDIFGPTVERMLDDYGKGVADMVPVDANATQTSKFLSALRNGDLTPVMEREMNKGLVSLATDPLIGSDVFMREEMHKVMTHFQAQTQADPGALGKVLDGYTRFFKTYATATPGFHVRNALSAMFMNLTEGTTFREMIDGQRIWYHWRKNPTGDWMAKLPPQLREKAPAVMDAVYASGAGGRFSAAELAQRAAGKKASRVTENWITKRSQNVGERVEGAVRAGLALHALNEGDDTMSAIMRIKRVHFDYSDVNETDAAIRRYIPFWTFMSRNLPLQVQQMWLKPRTYAQYNSLQRNFQMDDAGSQYMPDWMQAQGAFMLGPGTAVAPDIGATQLQEQLEMFTNPKRLMSAANPLLKVPAQLLTNQDFYYGNPYKENDFQVMGPDTSWLGSLLTGTGLTENTPQGVVAERRHLDSLYDLVPMLAQINRLGTTTPNREGTELQAALNYLGVPLKFIKPTAEREQILRERRASGRESPAEARLRALAAFG